MATPNWDSLRPVLEPALEVLELERQKVRRKTTHAAIWAVGLALAVAIGASAMMGGFNFPVFFVPGILAAIFVGWVHSSAAKEYASGFKLLVMPHLVRSFGELEYQSFGGISEGDFIASGMFRSPDRYNSEDMVWGKLGATTIRFSEVHAEYRTQRTDSKGHTQTEYHDIFRGLFVIADFNKNFNGTTLVLPDTAQKFLGSFGQKLQGLGAKLSFNARELVKLEDPDFEKQFVVYSGDQVEARYILSPSLMRRLLDFREKCRADFHLAFLANHIYLAVPTTDNWFEPPMGHALTMDALAPYAQQLQFATGIVEALDLNTRIWSKQSDDDTADTNSDLAPPLPASNPLSPLAPISTGQQSRWTN